MTSLSMPRQSRAFTLLDLLFTLGIIALLIALLMPTLSRVRDSANTVACLSNLRQLGNAAAEYTAENHGFIVPAGYCAADLNTNTESWATLLVNGHYLPVPPYPATLAASPIGRSIFTCPSGSTDAYFNFSIAGPVAGADARANQPYRLQSLASGLVLDNWYGINCATTNLTPAAPAGALQLPCRRYPGSPLTMQTQFKGTSQLVFLFDGLFCNHSAVNAYRINARHGRRTQTNVLFFDGHAMTLADRTLPQSLGDFSLATLQNKYPDPKWRVDE